MRRQYSAEKRIRLVDLVARESTTVREAARRLGVRPSTAYYWVRQAAKISGEARAGKRDRVPAKARAAAEPAFLRLVRASEVAGGVELRIGAAILTVKPGFDAELLRAVVAALHEGTA